MIRGILCIDKIVKPYSSQQLVFFFLHHAHMDTQKVMIYNHILSGSIVYIDLDHYMAWLSEKNLTSKFLLEDV